LWDALSTIKSKDGKKLPAMYTAKKRKETAVMEKARAKQMKEAYAVKVKSIGMNRDFEQALENGTKLSLTIYNEKNEVKTVTPLEMQEHLKTNPKWNSLNLINVSEILLKSYFNQTDAVICADYRTTSGCESYLRSILENPGCGIFLPEVSFMGLDESDRPCGFIIGCRLSSGVGMIPQIAVHPAYQGKKLGNALMDRTLMEFRNMGFQRVTLTVTSENRRAYEWYGRLGFQVRKDFGAFVWER